MAEAIAIEFAKRLAALDPPGAVDRPDRILLFRRELLLAFAVVLADDGMDTSESPSSSSITTQSSSLSLRIVKSPSQSPFCWLLLATATPLLGVALLLSLLFASGPATAATAGAAAAPASLSFARPPSSTRITAAGFAAGFTATGSFCCSPSSSLSESELILTGLSSSSSFSAAATLFAPSACCFFADGSTGSSSSFAVAFGSLCPLVATAATGCSRLPPSTSIGSSSSSTSVTSWTAVVAWRLRRDVRQQQQQQLPTAF
uniref:Uncharacterized protein n=1 Tax=Anopheles farauti TaxID=69004 RepID=A0A182R0D7_9DIPT